MRRRRDLAKGRSEKSRCKFREEATYSDGLHRDFSDKFSVIEISRSRVAHVFDDDPVGYLAFTNAVKLAVTNGSTVHDKSKTGVLQFLPLHSASRQWVMHQPHRGWVAIRQ